MRVGDADQGRDGFRVVAAHLRQLGLDGRQRRLRALEARVEEAVERRLQVGEIDAEGVLDGGVLRLAAAVAGEQLLQPGVAEPLDDVLHHQRRLVIRQADRAAVGERGVQRRQRDRLAGGVGAQEIDLALAAPAGVGAALLEHRGAFGEPARHALVRQLQGDDVGELVPQRRRPVERAGRARPGRVEGHDAAEAGAERADHAGQAERADGEIVVAREHLDQHGPARRDVVALAEIGERLARQLLDRVAHQRQLLRVDLQDQIADGDRLETVERVEHRQRVVGDDVERVAAERRVERRARRGFVAGAQQVHPERGLRARIGRLDLHRLAPLRHRLLEAVVGGELGADDAIDGARPRPQRQHALRQRVGIGGAILDGRDRRLQRQRLDLIGIDRQHLANLFAGIGEAAAVERLLGEPQVRGDAVRIDGQRLVEAGARGARIVVGHRRGVADQRRHPARIGLQRRLERLGRFLGVVLVEEQLGPGGGDARIVLRVGRRLLERGAGPPRLVERGERAALAIDGQRPPVVSAVIDDGLPQLGSFIAKAHVAEHEPELERCVAGGRLGDLGLEALARGLQPPARGIGAGQDDPPRRRRAGLGGQRLDVGEASFDEGPLGGVDRRPGGCGRRRLGRGGRGRAWRSVGRLGGGRPRRGTAWWRLLRLRGRTRRRGERHADRKQPRNGPGKPRPARARARRSIHANHRRLSCSAREGTATEKYSPRGVTGVALFDAPSADTVWTRGL